MICPSCNEKCEASDFLPNQDICFRCMYKAKKLAVIIEKKEKKTFCKMCKKEIVRDEESRKRQRNVYCSQECAKKGHKNTNDNFWTRKFREDNPLNSQFYA